MTCPKCQGQMWDNREKKASGEFKKTGPDFSCKDKQGCGHVIWPPRAQRPSQPVSEYTGNPSFTEDAKLTRQREPLDEWQPGKPEAIPTMGPSLKDAIIAREAAGNALGRFFAQMQSQPTFGVFINKVDILANYYLTGKIPAGTNIDTEPIPDIPADEEGPLPWEDPAQ